MIKIFYAALLLFTMHFNVEAKTSKQAATAPKVVMGYDPMVVDNAYRKEMRKYFNRLVQISTEQKNATDFFAELFNVDPNDSKTRKWLEQVFKADKLGKISAIDDGIEILYEGKKTSLKLDNEIGKLTENKTTAAHFLPDVNSFASFLNRSTGSLPVALINVLQPEIAKALPPLHKLITVPAKWVAEGGGKFADLTFNITEYKFKKLKFTDKLKTIGDVVARSTASGAAVGCVAGIHGQLADDCKQGAAWGAAIGAAVPSATLLAIVSIDKAANKFIDATYVVEDLYASNKAFRTFTHGILNVGVIATIAHGANKGLNSQGVKLVCSIDGSYMLYDREIGQSKDKKLYEYNNYANAISFDGYSYSGNYYDNKYEAALRQQFPMQANSDEQQYNKQIELIAKAMATEVASFRSSCKKHGPGYTEEFWSDANAAAGINANKATLDEAAPPSSPGYIAPPGPPSAGGYIAPPEPPSPVRVAPSSGAQ